jgi:hypothetical protein
MGPHSAACVVPMPAGNDLPNLSSNHCANLFGWREDLPELADYLRRVGEGEKTARASAYLPGAPVTVVLWRHGAVFTYRRSE